MPVLLHMQGNLKTAACFLIIEKLTTVNFYTEVENIMTHRWIYTLKGYSVILTTSFYDMNQEI